jgi:hypothetical protein
MASLRLAVTVGLLDGNPMSKDHNSTAHVVSTSDNATLYGHRITPDAHVSAEYGAMARTLIGGYTIGEEGGAFRPPAELHLPLFGTTFDADYASMVYRLLRKEDNLSARLARAIEWLDLGWRNTTSIPPELRIVVLRSGFEALLSTGTSDKIFELMDALSALLDPPTVTKQLRHWTKPLSDPRAAAPHSDLEWWFVEFSLLRNDIAHGNPIAARRFSLNGEHHVMLGERALRRAIKATVLPYGPKSLALNPRERALRRAFAAALRTHRRKTRQASHP